MSPLGSISVLLLIAGLTSGQKDSEVETTYGPVVGTEDTYSGETVRRFRGIPFAKPPTGKRRFLPPEEPDKWTDPLDTKEYSQQCYQLSISPEFQGNLTGKLSEDCLYLNVFAPKGGSNLPVMVWIHGGGLVLGSASGYNPETLASTGDVVVVTINYRLDIFGFYSSGNHIVEGNAGLLDQIMALKWVKNNIKNFGGDPEKVTIFGESAGGWSVSLHMISPMSKGLFQRAISQSGCLYGYNLPGKKSFYSKTNLLATELNCTDTLDSRNILACLQDAPANALLAASYSPKVTFFPRGLVVTVGTEFLPKDPTYLWEHGEINEADFILGINSEEGSIGFAAIRNQTVIETFLNIGIREDNPFFAALGMTAMSAIQSNPNVSPDNPLWRLLSAQYLTDYSDSIQNMRGMLNMVADTFFTGPVMNTAQFMAKRTNRTRVYLYYFDQVLMPTKTLPPKHMAAVTNYTGSAEMNVRAAHAAEISYVFGYISDNSTDLPGNIYDYVSVADRDVGKSMMNAWVSFATTGKPKVLINDGAKEVDWPEYDAAAMEYVEFKDPMSEGSIKKRLLPNRVGIFTDILPKLLKKPDDTTPAIECEDTPSTIDRDKAETALFILVAAVIVLLLMTLVLIMNYYSMKKELKKKEEDEKYIISD